MTAVTKQVIEHYEVSWRGLRVLVAFEADAFGTSRDLCQFCHLELINALTGKALPVSETGYRSHYIPVSEVDAAGGPVKYATAWLDAASRSAAWKAIEREQRQGCLF